MFDDDDDDDDINLSAIKETPKYGNNKDYNKFKKEPKKDPTDVPNTPIVFFVDKSYPEEIKNKIFHYINKLMSKKINIRINGDDKEFIEKVNELKYSNLEIYIPFKGFNDIESKLYFNDETSKLIAAKYMPTIDKLPPVVQSLLARNARLLFGNKNDSCAVAIITWSPDGATKLLEIGKDTGRASHIIKMAVSNFISVLNLQKPNCDIIFNKTFKLEE